MSPRTWRLVSAILRTWVTDLTELKRLSPDRVLVLGRVPLPHLARGSAEPDIGRLAGNRQVPVAKGPAKGIDADHGDVFEAVGRAAFLAQHVVHGLGVRPGFHQAGADA